MKLRGLCFSFTLAWLLPAAAAAQAVRGVVVDQSDRPVAGAVVQLLDSTATVVARALSNERGEYRLGASRAGTYRVRTLRIGYRPETSAPVVVRIGQEVPQRLVLAGIAISLDAIRIVDRGACRSAGDSAAATFAVWEQVRTALTATQLSGNARNIAATTVTYERTLDPGGRRVQHQSANLSADFVTQPWRAVSPDSLHRSGYVATDVDGGTVYFAPGLDALLSNAFIEDHCLRIATAKDQSRIGISFEPTGARKNVPEIRGALWLDRSSSELRSLEFKYVNVSSEQEGIAAGDMEFARMKNGAWAVTRWNIRMPVLQQVLQQQRFGGERVKVAEIRVAGGELALARRGNDTIWSRPPLVLAGTVQDSVSGASITGAKVALGGTTLEGTTDARGRFSIPGVLPGEYTLEVRTPSLDSVSAVHQSTLTVTDAADPIQLKVPGAQQIVAGVCSATRASGGARADGNGIVLGRVSMLGDTVPPKNVAVVAEWTDLSLRGEGRAVVTDRIKRWLETKTDARGGFRLCGVPVSTALTLRAERDTNASATVDVKIPPYGRFARAELTLDRVTARAAVLTGVVVTDSTNLPIAGAEVSLPESGRSTLTNERGAFRLTDIPAGTHRVLVRRVGYGPADTPITFVAGQTVDRKVVLGRAVTLDSVVVTAAHRDVILEEFEENRKLGLGHFLTRAEIAKLEGAQLSTLIEQMPGIGIIHGIGGSSAWALSRVAPGSMSGNNVYIPEGFEVRQGVKMACYAQVFVDGIIQNRQIFQGRAGTRVTSPFDVNTIPPTQIEAIEFYASPAQTPMRYAGFGSACGVLVIHTRRVK